MLCVHFSKNNVYKVLYMHKSRNKSKDQQTEMELKSY